MSEPHKYTDIKTAWSEWMKSAPALKPGNVERQLFLCGAISAMYILKNGVDYQTAAADINVAWFELQNETGFKK
jgi:hypothetical protein